tara:strand:+ start:3437 stop:4396 length:960 start_codon:yes stop_codon:yes gene_type:complete
MSNRISIVTSVFNRANYIKRLYKSLCDQEFKDFEWIIGNDGSNDNIEEVIKGIIEDASFKIKFISGSIRCGKSKIDNKMISEASGDFIIFCDSDDWLEKNTLSRMLNEFEKNYDRNLAGVIGLAADNLNYNKSKFPDSLSKDKYKLVEIFFEHRFQDDCAFMIKTELLKNTKFQEIDMYIPEGSLWIYFSSYNFALCKEIMLNKEYNSDHRISFSRRFEYSRGKAVSMKLLYSFLFSPSSSSYKKIRYIFSYLRFSIHGDLNLNMKVFGWPFRTKILILSLLPFVKVLCFIDLMLKRVEKTHQMFNKSIKKVDYKILDN